MTFRTLPAIVALAAFSFAQTADTIRVGPLPDGSTLLNSGWRIRPAGKQIPLDTLPVASLASPDGKFLLVLHNGYNQPSIRVLAASDLRQVDEYRLDDAGQGMAFRPGGEILYVGGGSTGNVYEFAFSDAGKLELKRTLSTVPRDKEKSDDDFVGDVALSPDGRLLYAVCLFRNEIAVINPQSGWVIERFPTARRPYKILFHPGGKWFYITSWAEGSIHQHQADDGKETSLLRLGPQPMDMVWRDKPIHLEEEEAAPPWRARIFVTVVNTNRVYVLGVDDAGAISQVETIRVSLWPNQPNGMMPTSLALSPDQDRLYVVCSGANTVAAVDVSSQRSRVLGFIPAGWYPTDATTLDDGRLLVLNGRGERSHANPNGPNPLVERITRHRGSSAPGYVARLQTGTASVVELADQAQLFQFTKDVLRLSPYNDRLLNIVPIPEGSPIPPGPRAPEDLASPIKHVLYIVKGSRTYDEILGDVPTAAGNKKLAIFGEEVTPNQHKLAREYVLFDNFYAMGDTAPDGRLWSTAALVPPFVELFWPSTYAGRLPRHDYEHQDFAGIPATGYLWSHAMNAGLTVRNFGFMVENHPKGEGPENGEVVKTIRDRSLWNVTDRTFPGPGPDFDDGERAAVFESNLKKMDADGEMPQLMVMQLGDDRTSGLSSAKRTPKSTVADNDAALGLIVEACSKSRFWPKMAIFVVENDGADGSDHIDSHRSPALIISPYTRGGIIDSNFYNTAAMLRTIELILGLSPMTHFDAAAMPMWPAFQSKPDTARYESVRSRIAATDQTP